MYITVEEAAKVAQVSTRHIRTLLTSGKIAGKKERNIGKPGPKHWKVDRASLLSYIESTK